MFYFEKEMLLRAQKQLIVFGTISSEPNDIWNTVQAKLNGLIDTGMTDKLIEALTQNAKRDIT